MLLREYEGDQRSLKNSIQDLRETMPGPLAASFEKPFVSLKGLVVLIQCRTSQNQLERCCGFCLPRKTAEQPWHVCQDNPSTSEQAVYRQCSEISRFPFDYRCRTAACMRNKQFRAPIHLGRLTENLGVLSHTSCGIQASGPPLFATLVLPPCNKRFHLLSASAYMFHMRTLNEFMWHSYEDSGQKLLLALVLKHVRALLSFHLKRKQSTKWIKYQFVFPRRSVSLPTGSVLSWLSFRLTLRGSNW